MTDAVSPYAYVRNNPVNLVDPLGLMASDPTAAAGLISQPRYWGGGMETMVDVTPAGDGYDFSNGPVQVARADVIVSPRQGGGFNYRATDDQGSKPLQGTFNTGTTLNINQLPEGDYRVTPRPRVPEPGLLGQVRDVFVGDRNRNAGRPTISNTDNWNQVRFPNGSIHEGVQIHPGRQGTSGGNSLGCMVCSQAEYNLLNDMFKINYSNGGVFLHVVPQAPKQ